MKSANVTSFGGTANFRIDLKPPIFDAQVIWNNYPSGGKLKVIHSNFLLWKLSLLKLQKKKWQDTKFVTGKIFIMFHTHFWCK